MLNLHHCYLFISFINGCSAYLTSEITVLPYEVLARPGDNVTFTCNSSIDIHRLRWVINGKDVDSEDVTLIDSHSMKLHITNVGIDTALSESAIVECMTADNLRNGATLNIGYPPVISKFECMARDLSQIYCRWSDYDERTDGKPWSGHGAAYKLSYIVKNNVEGTCTTQSTSAVCEHPQKWHYAYDMVFSLSATNSLGNSNASLYFEPHRNVMLSPPVIKVRNATDNEEKGACLSVASTFSSYFFERGHASCSHTVELQYAEVPEGADEEILPQRLDLDEFWNDWSTFADTEKYYRPFPFPDRFDKVDDDKKETLCYLKAMTRYLIRSRWKFNGGGNIFFHCNGSWSLFSSLVVTTSMLEPPPFEAAAVLYSKSLPTSENANVTTVSSKHSALAYYSSPMLLWRHSQAVMKLHEKNYLLCDVSVMDCSLSTEKNVSKFSHVAALPADIIGQHCAVMVACGNSKISQMSSRFIFDSDAVGDGCELTVLSIKLKNMTSTRLRFAVRWAVLPRNVSHHCREDIDEAALKAGVFIWREYRMPPIRVAPQRADSSYVVKSFHLELEGREFLDGQSYDSDIFFDTKEYRKETVTFSQSLEPHVPYRIAVSLSLLEGTVVLQGPATIDRELYYFNVKEPSGAVSEIMFGNVAPTSMEIKWTEMDLDQRNGAITSYSVYYTTNEKCFAGHQIIVCDGLYDACGPENLQVVQVLLPAAANNVPGNMSVSWSVEEVGRDQVACILSGLKPSTTYFIGVVAENAAGRGKCFHHVVKTTPGMRDPRVIYLPVMALAAVILLFFILYWKRDSVKTYFNSPLPDPVIHVRVLKQEEDQRDDGLVYERDREEVVDSIDVSLLKNNNETSKHRSIFAECFRTQPRRTARRGRARYNLSQF